MDAAPPHRSRSTATVRVVVAAAKSRAAARAAEAMAEEGMAAETMAEEGMAVEGMAVGSVAGPVVVRLVALGKEIKFETPGSRAAH